MTVGCRDLQSTFANQEIKTFDWANLTMTRLHHTIQHHLQSLNAGISQIILSCHRMLQVYRSTYLRQWYVSHTNWIRYRYWWTRSWQSRIVVVSRPRTRGAQGEASSVATRLIWHQHEHLTIIRLHRMPHVNVSVQFSQPWSCRGRVKS